MKRFEYNYIFINHHSKWISTPSYYDPFPVICYLDNFKEAKERELSERLSMIKYCHYMGLKRGKGKIRTFDWKLKIYFYLLKRKLR